MTVGFTQYFSITDAFDGQPPVGQHIQNLERGMESNREIRVAVGVLMARHRITGELPFPPQFSHARHRPRRAPEASA